MNPRGGHGQSADFDFPLDVLVSRQPRLNRLYTQITLCFKPVDDPASSVQSDIVHTLTKGVERLSQSFPWVAGRVINEDGTFKIIRRPHHTIPLVVKDFRTDDRLPSFEELKEANFPFSMLDECVVAPYNTFTDPSLLSEMPVLAMQANFLAGDGGGALLLTFNGQHGAMDMAGQGQVMHLLAKACRDEAFTSEELQVGNMDRRNVISLFLDEEHSQTSDPERPSHHTPTRDSRGSQAQATEAEAELTWAYFTFSRTSLGELKALATEHIPRHTFVSTDDVLSALTWQSITRARLPRSVVQDPSNPTTTTLSRNVDMRRHMSLPSTYTGFMTESTTHTALPTTLLATPLGMVAWDLRSALDGDKLRHKTRVKATIESRREREREPADAPPPKPTSEVRLSSWAKETKCHDLDFGFGRPVAVRRPRFARGARDGLVYFLPKAPDGEIAVGVCLRREDLERLKGDSEFVRWGMFVG